MTLMGERIITNFVLIIKFYTKYCYIKMKKILLTLLGTVALSLVSLCAQSELNPKIIANIKTIDASFFDKEANCNNLINYYDLDESSLQKYSSISIKSEKYVESFGEYELKPYQDGIPVMTKIDGKPYIDEIGYDSEKGAYHIAFRETYLVVRGSSGATYNNNGERDNKSEAKLDASGRIESISWGGQERIVTYNNSGSISSITMDSSKYSVIWKNGALAEIITNNTYGDKKQTGHIWYEIVEKNADGLWTVLDEYKNNSNGKKIKTKRYTRIFL